MSEDVKVEKHHRAYGVVPEVAFEHHGVKVRIGDGGPFYDWSEEATKEEFPTGYYQSVVQIDMPKEDGGILKAEVPLIFDRFHNHDMSEAARKKARIKAAEKAAIQILDDYEQQRRTNH